MIDFNCALAISFPLFRIDLVADCRSTIVHRLQKKTLFIMDGRPTDRQTARRHSVIYPQLPQLERHCMYRVFRGALTCVIVLSLPLCDYLYRPRDRDKIELREKGRYLPTIVTGRGENYFCGETTSWHVREKRRGRRGWAREKKGGRNFAGKLGRFKKLIAFRVLRLSNYKFQAARLIVYGLIA